MKAMQVRGNASGVGVLTAHMEEPLPGPGQVQIRVHAAGVTPTELGWYPTNFRKDGSARADAVPCHEFSGIVRKLGEGVAGLAIGQAVYGMNDWFEDGALAEFCLAVPECLAHKPVTLSHAEAATVPMGALTAWQGLFDRGGLQPGETALVIGGAGAVGLFAVQLAHTHGARVLTTAAAEDLALTREMGADEAVDYRTASFAKWAGSVDVVFDTVGGETLAGAWTALKPNGRMVTIASGESDAEEQRVKDAFFIVEPKRDQLMEVAKRVDAGSLRTFVKAEIPFERAGEAFSPLPIRRPGKIVVRVVE